MNLEFIPVREAGSSKRVPKDRHSLRLYWIVRESAKSPLSGGYALGVVATSAAVTQEDDLRGSGLAVPSET